jgi:hypothetical protein
MIISSFTSRVHLHPHLYLHMKLAPHWYVPEIKVNHVKSKQRINEKVERVCGANSRNLITKFTRFSESLVQLAPSLYIHHGRTHLHPRKLTPSSRLRRLHSQTGRENVESKLSPNLHLQPFYSGRARQIQADTAIVEASDGGQVEIRLPRVRIKFLVGLIRLFFFGLTAMHMTHVRSPRSRVHITR